jgi:hypothetical protein
MGVVLLSCSTPNDLIRGKEMCFCSQLKVCSKQLMRKLPAKSGSAVCFDTTVAPHEFLDRTVNGW